MILLEIPKELSMRKVCKRLNTDISSNAGRRIRKYNNLLVRSLEF